MLEVVLPLDDKIFNVSWWIFKLDWAPAYKVKQTQDYLRDNLPAFTEAENWPSGSPTLENFENIVCWKRHCTIESLNKSIVSALKKIEMHTNHPIIDEFPIHLQKCVAANDGHFE